MIRNKLQRLLEVTTAFIFLNLLWFIFCLPIVTIYPSTAAMFGIVRKWKIEGIDYEIRSNFISLFKENFKKSFLLGIIWSVIGALMTMDFYLLMNLSFSGKSAVIGLLIFCTFIYVGMSIYMLPITVNFHLSTKEIIKNALFFTIGKIGTTVLCVMVIASIVIICYFIPFLLWIVGSTAAFFVYTIISNLNQGLWMGRNNGI
ncbi:DUF624 domain-containing protein [Virgibacillus necropolis]|uniref:YesL family protein n=1 Tax=Virgibacillus necropolis TaxID=163877 RepID=UPI00384B1140